jgi:hypothetical protein
MMGSFDKRPNEPCGDPFAVMRDRQSFGNKAFPTGAILQ